MTGILFLKVLNSASNYNNIYISSYAELDPFVLILSKMKESKTMTRSVRAGLPRESVKNYCTSTDGNQGSVIFIFKVFFLQ